MGIIHPMANSPAMSTSMAPGSLSASQRVAYTTELLENILLHLDDGNSKENGTKTILFSQAVCHKFRDTIRGSPELQKALFLSPTPGEFFNTNSTIRNSLLLTYFQSQGAFGFHIGGKLFDIGIFPHGYAQISDRIRNDMWVTWRCHGPSDKAWTSHKDASWRKMYVMQCDYRVITVQVRVAGCAGYREVNMGKLTNPTFGELYDVAFRKSSIKVPT